MLPAYANPALLYGLTRSHAREAGAGKAASSGGWMVMLLRRGRRITRFFADTIYGSTEAAQAQAIAYRDTILSLLPPITNREQAVKQRRNNKSGISGIRLIAGASGGSWQATLLTTKDGRQHQKTKRFSVALYGQDRAKRLAIEQRQVWLNQLPATFLALAPEAEGMACLHFGNRLAQTVEVEPGQSLASTATFDTHLQAIDRQFDQKRPARLRVRVSEYKVGEFSLFVSDGGRPAKNGLVRVFQRGGECHTAPPELSRLVDVIEGRLTQLIDEIYGSAITRWFMEEHGIELLNPVRFRHHRGFSICVMIPATFA